MSAIDFTITDDMVEALASAQYEHTEREPWADAHPADRDEYRTAARAGLHATGHLIAAAAIRRTSHRYTQRTGYVVFPSARDFLDRTATDYEAGVTPSA